eukprot:362659-Chlamydomonas_euryale.AAC.2
MSRHACVSAMPSSAAPACRRCAPPTPPTPPRPPPSSKQWKSTPNAHEPTTCSVIRPSASCSSSASALGAWAASRAASASADRTMSGR